MSFGGESLVVQNAADYKEKKRGKQKSKMRRRRRMTGVVQNGRRECMIRTRIRHDGSSVAAPIRARWAKTFKVGLRACLPGRLKHQSHASLSRCRWLSVVSDTWCFTSDGKVTMSHDEPRGIL